MTVMVANNTGKKLKQLAAQFPGKIGHLYGPGTNQLKPVENFQYALDNNRFGSFKDGRQWNEESWIDLIKWGGKADPSPLWAIVPDVVGDRTATLSDWNRYHGVISEHGIPLAFAVQDGMSASDVPSNASVVFIGGTTEWKWATMRLWCKDFPRVHVGRVNTYGRLFECHDAGAESVDGTGWVRGCQRQWRGLVQYLQETSGVKPRDIQSSLF